MLRHRTEEETTRQRRGAENRATRNRIVARAQHAARDRVHDRGRQAGARQTERAKLRGLTR